MLANVMIFSNQRENPSGFIDYSIQKMLILERKCKRCILKRFYKSIRDGKNKERRAENEV